VPGSNVSMNGHPSSIMHASFSLLLLSLYHLVMLIGNPVFGSKTENRFYDFDNWFSNFFPHFRPGNYIPYIVVYKSIHV